MDILMNQLRMRLIWKENEGSGADYVPTGDTFNDSTFAQWNVGSRDLCMRVLMQKAVYPSDADPYYEYTMFDDETVVSYTTNEGGTDGFGIGSSIASSYTLILDNSSHQYTSADFTNTRFAAAIGIKVNGHVKYEPFGVWSVTDVDAAEQSSVVTIQGVDMLGFYYDDTFWPFTGDDAAIEIDYGSISGMMDAITQIWSDIPWGLNIGDDGNVIADPTDYPLFDWGVAYEYAGSSDQTKVNNCLAQVPPETMYQACAKGGVTRRQAITWSAVSICGILRIARDGRLEIRRYEDHTIRGSELLPTIDPTTYFSYTPDGIEPFDFNRTITYYYTDSSFEETNSVNEAKTYSIETLPSNTVEIAANPITSSYTASLAYDIFYHGINFDQWGGHARKHDSASVSFVGAPQVKESRVLQVTDKDDVDHYIIPTRISATYDGGFSMTVESKFPSDNTAYSSSFNSSTTLLTYTKELAYGRANQAAYSTDEQVTGQRWIDGKPIYRKVITGSVGTTESTLATVSNIDTVIGIHGSYRRTSDGRCQPTNYYYSSSTYNYVIIDSDGAVKARSSHAGTDIVILEYTKSTD